MAPSTTSSMLGWVAAVIETESPSQLRPAVIQRTWISFTSGGRSDIVPWEPIICAMATPLRSNTSARFASDSG